MAETGTGEPRGGGEGGDPGIRSIAVLRAGGLGDVLLALPAIRALADAYPGARLTLLGTPLAAELLARRAGIRCDAVGLPPIPGVGAAPDAVVDHRLIAECIRGQRRAAHDLVVQLHGGGRYSNGFVRRLRGGLTVGARTPNAAELDRWIDYAEHQHEILRCLDVVALAGAVPSGLDPRVIPTADELAYGRSMLRGRPLAVLHPGASDPRRRASPECFAVVVERLVRLGADVLLVGGAGTEARLCARIRALADERGARADRIRDVAGEIGIRSLVGLLASADLLVGNDSGPRHLAQAVGTRTAAVFWMGNLISAGPLSRVRHRVQVSWTTVCPVCGVDCAPRPEGPGRCPHDVSFVGDIDPVALADDAERLLRETAAERAAGAAGAR